MAAPRDDIGPLKARLRLSALIGKTVKLTRRDGDWWGQCPFHQEKTGSFSVNDAKGFFHCFGCRAHGDVLDWWQRTEGMGLADAIERLKHEAGEKAEEPRPDLKRPWAAVTRHAGLEGLRLHDLRHNFASFGAGGGLGLPIIGRLLGHSQPSTTARYAHLDTDPLRRASDKIAAGIAAALSGNSGGGNVVKLKQERN